MSSCLQLANTHTVGEILPPSKDDIDVEVARALAEDLGEGDLTAALIPEKTTISATLYSREPAVLCGTLWFNAAFHQLDPSIKISWLYHDGEAIPTQEKLCRVTGEARAILSGERTALNFLQLLSGTATTTHRYATLLKESGTTLLDTRKTVPGLRLSQKYAVRCGGGRNHRIGLYDMVLIKENHIAAAGSITAAVTQARELYQHRYKIEVEVETLDEVEEGAASGADILLLDNMDPEQLRQAVMINRHRCRLEISGSVTLANLRSYALSGIDFISVGALTKAITPIDLSLRFD
ncbi:MAG: carboxylating nicotinate-nucleotide diphosphorylase [Gammaproteobacteria bacterium]|nr:carboxylating nicotinate-nucleotide diphosphorylase [Gammaproteobacteria bacterium]